MHATLVEIVDAQIVAHVATIVPPNDRTVRPSAVRSTNAERAGITRADLVSIRRAARSPASLPVAQGDGDRSAAAVIATALGRVVGGLALFLAKGVLSAGAILGGLLLATTGGLWLFNDVPVPGPVADIADAGRDLVVDKAAPQAPVAMPTLTGVNLADAKDSLRAAGHRNIASVDASADRTVLWARNWTVTAQDPPPGVTLVAGQRIVLTVDKP